MTTPFDPANDPNAGAENSLWTDGKGTYFTGHYGTTETPLNTSGLVPLDKRVLVLPDAVKDREGSILLPDEVKEQNQWAQAKGTLIAVGETAWSEAMDDAQRHGAEFTPPIEGDRILFAKYGGAKVKGDDGREYRIMNDEDVIARLDEKEG